MFKLFNATLAGLEQFHLTNCSGGRAVYHHQRTYENLLKRMDPANMLYTRSSLLLYNPGVHTTFPLA